jgi:PAS domain S-box-containing protein
MALSWLGVLITLGNPPSEIATEHLVERGVSTMVIGLVALVVALVVAREAENTELVRTLRGAEESRSADKRMLAAASEIAAIGTWSIDVDDDRMTLSDEAARMLGVASETHPLRSEVLGHMDPADAKTLGEHVEAAWERGIPFRQEVRSNPPGGTPRWIVTMGERVRLGEDSVARVHGTVQDITTWKQAELAASDQHNRLAQLTRSLPIIVWTADPQGNIEYFNDALVEYTGSAPEDLLGDKWSAAVDPRDLDAVVAAWTESLETGKAYDIEYRVRGADGVYRWHHLAAQPELDDAGTIVRWWGTSINVDATRHLREEADKLAADREIILESTTDGIFALDHEWRVVFMNASALRILEIEHVELRDRVLWEVFPHLDGAELHEFLKETRTRGAPARLTYRSTLADKWLEMSATPSASGVTVFFRDVTEVRRLSERLAQSQRLEAVGQLTGGIAHDFNNLLTVVLGGADALAADDSMSDQAKEMADMITAAAERGAELTHRLLAFARKQPLEPQAVDLAARLRTLEPLLRRTLGEDISVVVGPCDGDALALVDPGQYDNAVLNLAINARDAMAQGGSITFEVETFTVDDSGATTLAEVAPGTYVVTTVTDSGEGIPAEDLSRLFDPFFTTKEPGKGSGLGLAMVWGFVKQSGGNVTVYSEPDIGTSFRLYLPTAGAGPATETPTSGQLHTEPVTGTILLAEDDDLVRRFATDRLRSRGYDVVEAGSGPDALKALGLMDRLDLLFTDVIMPGGMTGRELADAVLALRPGTPVLYASGYTEDVIIHNGRLDKGVHLLAKPYSARQLLSRVGELVMPTSPEVS